MDKSIYVAMTGAKEVLRAQTANNHNLANATTTGFRADLAAFMSRAVEGPGYASRAYATTSTLGWSHDGGSIVATGRDLQVAAHGGALDRVDQEVVQEQVHHRTVAQQAAGGLADALGSQALLSQLVLHALHRLVQPVRQV